MLLVAGFLIAPWCVGHASAQGPDFAGLPQTENKDLATVVQSLLTRVAELERRVDALEKSQANFAGNDKPQVDPEATKALAAAISEKEKLVRHLDGTERAVKDPKIRASHAREKENWDTVVADVKRFSDALKKAVDKASGLGDGKSSLEGLVKWARGRSVFQSRQYVNAVEQLILPVDFATDLFPYETK